MGSVLCHQLCVNNTDDTVPLGTILEDIGKRSLVLLYSIDIMESGFLHKWSRAKLSRIPKNSHVFRRIIALFD